MNVLAMQRLVLCGGCGRPFTSNDLSRPYCCDRCMQQAYQAEMQVCEAEAIAEGFASLDDYIEFQMRAVEVPQ